jgi:hypothetical protein
MIHPSSRTATLFMCSHAYCAPTYISKQASKQCMA